MVDTCFLETMIYIDYFILLSILFGRSIKKKPLRRKKSDLKENKEKKSQTKNPDMILYLKYIIISKKHIR